MKNVLWRVRFEGFSLVDMLAAMAVVAAVAARVVSVAAGTIEKSRLCVQRRLQVVVLRRGHGTRYQAWRAATWSVNCNLPGSKLFRRIVRCAYGSTARTKRSVELIGATEKLDAPLDAGGRADIKVNDLGKIQLDR